MDDRPVPFRRLRLPALLAALLVVLAACASPAAPSATSAAQPSASVGPAASATASPAPSPSAAASPSASPLAVTFPLTVTDDEGTTVTIPAAPQRIVSLTPATTELLFKLGIGDRVVGKVQDLTPYPPESTKVPDVAKFGEINVEQTIGLNPDLVIAGGNNFLPADSIRKLRDLKVPTIVIYAPNLDTVYHDLELTGEVVGKPAEAEAIVDGIRADFATVEAATASLPKPRVHYELDDYQGVIYGAADDSFLTDMIRLAGGTPITSGSPDKYDIPAERLIQQDPQVILLADHQTVKPEDVGKRPGWDVISAVRTNDIRPIDDTTVTRPGPRLGEGLRALALAIHPDLVLPSPTG